MTASISSVKFAYNQTEEISESILKLQNTKEKAFFKKKRNTKTKKLSMQERKIKRSNKTFHPRKHCLGENSKLNLYLLTLCKNTEQKQCFEKAVFSLLKDLYGNDVLFQKAASKDPLIFEHLAKEICIGAAQEIDLAKIPFSSNIKRNLYVAICNGTEKKRKSFLNYLTYKKISNKQAIVITHLSRPVLKALFGNDILQRVLEEEKRRYYLGFSNTRIPKTRFDKILGQTSFPKEFIGYKALKISAALKKTTSNNETLTLAPDLH